MWSTAKSGFIKRVAPWSSRRGPPTTYRSSPKGLAPISVGGTVGFIDTTGATVIQPEYEFASDFHEGLARVIRDGQTEYIDQSGTTVFPLPGVLDRGEFSEGLAYFSRMEGETQKYGYIDSSGTVVIEPRYDVATEFRDGLAAVALGHPDDGDVEWGYIDTTGSWIVEPSFASATSFSEDSAVVTLRGYGSQGLQYGWVDPAGTLRFGSEWAVIQPYAEGLAAVAVAGEFGKLHFGFVGASGTPVIARQFDAVGDFSQGRAAIGQTDDGGEVKWGYIDATGTVVVQPQYQFAGPFLPGGVALVVRSGREPVVQMGSPDRYLGFWRFVPGGATFGDDEPFDMAYIDKTGKVIWETPRLPISEYSGG